MTKLLRSFARWFSSPLNGDFLQLPTHTPTTEELVARHRALIKKRRMMRKWMRRRGLDPFEVKPVRKLIEEQPDTPRMLRLPDDFTTF